MDVVGAGLDDHNLVAHFVPLLCWCSDSGGARLAIQAFVSLVVCLYSDGLGHRAFSDHCGPGQTRLQIAVCRPSLS